MARPCGKEVNRALLQALACGGSIEHAARKAGLGERTAYRRLADPKFQAQLTQVKAEMVQRAAAMLTAASMGSVKTLGDMQQDVSGAAAGRDPWWGPVPQESQASACEPLPATQGIERRLLPESAHSGESHPAVAAPAVHCSWLNLARRPVQESRSLGRRFSRGPSSRSPGVASR